MRRFPLLVPAAPGTGTASSGMSATPAGRAASRIATAMTSAAGGVIAASGVAASRRPTRIAAAVTAAVTRRRARESRAANHGACPAVRSRDGMPLGSTTLDRERMRVQSNAIAAALVQPSRDMAKVAEGRTRNA